MLQIGRGMLQASCGCLQLLRGVLQSIRGILQAYCRLTVGAGIKSLEWIPMMFFTNIIWSCFRVGFCCTHDKLNKSCWGAIIKHDKLVRLTKIFWGIYSGTHSLMTSPQYACKIPLIDCNTTLSDCKHPLLIHAIFPYRFATFPWVIELFPYMIRNPVLHKACENSTFVYIFSGRNNLVWK